MLVVLHMREDKRCREKRNFGIPSNGNSNTNHPLYPLAKHDIVSFFVLVLMQYYTSLYCVRKLNIN